MTVYVVVANQPGIGAEALVLAAYQTQIRAEEFAEGVEGGALVQAVEVQS